MLKINTLILAVGLSVSTFSQTEQPFSSALLDKSEMKTDLLLINPNPFSPILKVEKTDYSMFDFSSIYKELAKNDELNRFNKTEEIQASLKPYTLENEIVPIGVIISEFEVIRQEAFENEWVTLEGNSLKSTSTQNIYQDYITTAITPFVKRKIGTKTTFVLASDFIVNTTENSITKVRVDFDDGNGFVEINTDSPLEIQYPTDGKKTLYFKIALDNGEMIERSSTFHVEYSTDDMFQLFNTDIQTITSVYAPDLSIYNEADDALGICQYQIFVSPDSILDKPIFVVDGFDPADGRNIQAIYNLLQYTDNQGNIMNLGDFARNEEGYDIVIVNFPIYVNSNGNIIDGGADYIERNALSFVTVLEEINAMKEGDEQNIIIGPSMGGLISRYALRYMEMNDLEHDTRLWISMDSPHLGANVSIALQHLINYLGYGYPDIDEIKMVMNGMVRSPSAKQMLIDHIDGHINGITEPTGAPGFFTPFYQRMDEIGYPQNTRNVSLINGSGIGNIFLDLAGNPVYPGYNILDGIADVSDIIPLINARFNINGKFMPYAGELKKIVKLKIQAQLGLWVDIDNFEVTAKQNEETDGIDTAPGGLFDLLGLLNDFEVDPQYMGVLENILATVNVGKFNFIPAVSAMAIHNETDFYFDLTTLGEGDEPWDEITNINPLTPFVNWYMPEENQGHVDLTEENTNFLICEIVKPDYHFRLPSYSNNIIKICEGQGIQTPLLFEVAHGCIKDASISITGAPNDSFVFANATTLQDGETTQFNAFNLPIGHHEITITPNGKDELALTLTIIVSEYNSNLTGKTEYSLNGLTFIQAEEVTIAPGSNLSLRIPDEIYTGSVIWYSPNGDNWGQYPSIPNIQAGSDLEGTWRALILFEVNACTPAGTPTLLEFEVTVDPSLSLEDNSLENVQIFPNPSDGLFYINGLENHKTIRVTVYDYKGSAVLNHSFSNSSEITMDLSNYSNGIYFVELEVEKSIVRKKLTVLH